MDNDIVEKFCTITEASVDTANYYLEASDGDFDSALEMFFARDADAATTSKRNDNDDEDDVRKPIPQKSDILVEESFHSSYAPLTRRPLAQSVFDKFRDLESESKDRAQALLEKTGKAGSNSKEAQRVELKRKTLESLFRPPIEIMHRGVFESAKETAVSQNRWLLVNIQNSEEFACQTLNRDVWNHPMVRELVQANFVLWQIYHDSADGRRFQTYYPVESFPFVGVVDPRTGELVTTFRTVSDASVFCDTAVCFLESRPEFGSYNSSPKIGTKQKKEEVQQKSNLKRKLANAIEVDEDDNDDDGDDDVVIIPHSRSVTTKKFSRLNDNKTNGAINGSECASTSSFSGTSRKARSEHWSDFCADTGQHIQLLFRLPSGEKHILTLSELSKLKAVFLYAGTELNLPFEQTDFLLNYPLRVLNKEDPSRTLRELGFNKQEVVFVEMH